MANPGDAPRESLRSRLKSTRRRVTRSEAFIDFLARVIQAFIVLHWKTLRVTSYTHPDTEPLDRNRVIYAFWHGRYYLMMPNYRDWGIVVLLELSWAGEVQSRAVERLGFLTVRGSTKRNAARVLSNMKRVVEDGHPPAFALDGPRGPERRSKPGVLLLAKKLGYPIVPVATSARRAFVTPGTWDRYLIALPFTRCFVGRGAPIPGSAEGTLTVEELDRAIDEWTAEADRRVGRRPDPPRTDGDEALETPSRSA
jgi:lysophospholipid acyltransferase (LPLAT)-like uncharacterized protein